MCAQGCKWARAKRGDPEAIEELVEEYYKLAFNLAYSWMRRGVIDYEEAQSIGYLALMKCIRGNYNPDKGSFSTYLGTAVNNEVRMFLRAQNKHSQVASLEELGMVAASNGFDGEFCIDNVLECEEDGPEECYLEQERREELEKLVRSVQKEMSENERLCFLYWLEGFTCVEIANKVSLSQGYVWRLVRSAKDKVHAYAERSDYDWKGDK